LKPGNIYKVCFLWILILFFLSCDILRDSPFEVLEWSPGNSYHGEPEKIIISLGFSHDPDQASVERHFSLSEDGDMVKGNFHWEGRRMRFIPLAQLEKNRDYVLALSAEAKDTNGLSMDSNFTGRFTTRPSSVRPVLLSCYPQMNDAIDDPRTEVNLVFSIPISLESLYDNVSFNPPKNGSWRLEEGGCTAVFVPSEPWTHNKRQEIRVSAALTDSSGMFMGKEFLSVFVVGQDHESPLLLEAWRLTDSSEFLMLAATAAIYGAEGELIENEGWERDDRLRLVFSKPVDGLSVNNCLSVEGAQGLVMETMPDFKNEFVFRFDTKPAYESRFTFRLKAGVRDYAGNACENEYIYRIYANGIKSIPPQLVGIRLPMAPGSGTDQQLVSFGIDSLFDRLPITDGNENYPSGEGIITWIEFYFITAPGASIDPFSLMELFRIETSNNVLIFSPRLVKTDGFSSAQPRVVWDNLERLEIAGVLTNSTNFGIVNFIISPGLRDSFGNKNEKSFRISILK